MTEYVALLRGIGPGNPKMRNPELVKVFQRLSLTNVRTVISSGNVLFEADERSNARLEARIEAALLDHLGAPCSTIVRSRRQFEKVRSAKVFDAYDDGPTNRCNVTFLKRRSTASSPPPQDFEGARIVAVEGQTVFSVIDTTSARTPDLMGRLEKAYGKEITTRTWRTVHRIMDRFAR